MHYRLHEIKTYRNKHQVFADRHEAGLMLAEMLAPHYAGAENGIVLSIPAGGVPIGMEVSRRLLIPHDLMIVRKLPIPGNTEAGFGAMDPEGRLILNEEMLRYLHLDKEQIEMQAAVVREELEKRNLFFREGKPFPDLAGMTVILVDDGLASGYTMLAAAGAVRKHGAARIVLAIPTGLLDSIEKVVELADEIFCVNVIDYWPFAVANAYRNWHDLSRREVAELLKGQTVAHQPG
jgi:putative phosphoribosyl transferase